MKIAIASDHGGFDLKEELKEYLINKGFEVNDVGTYSKESCHYPEFAVKCAEEVKNGTKRKDFLFLSVKTSPDVYKSLINKRPFLGTRDDYGDVEYINIKISEKDYNIVKDVLTKKPRIGFWLKQRNKKPS